MTSYARRALIVGTLCLGALGLTAVPFILSGCQLSAAQTKALETQAEQQGVVIGTRLGSCILNQVLSGNLSLAGIGFACGVPAGSTLGEVIAQMVADFSAPTTDGGASLAAGFSPSDRARIVSLLKAVQ